MGAQPRARLGLHEEAGGIQVESKAVPVARFRQKRCQDFDDGRILKMVRLGFRVRVVDEPLDGSR